MKNGYARVINGIDNTVKFGLWKDDLAHGKHVQYQIDIPEGKYKPYDINKTFVETIGIYDKGDCVKLCFFDNF